MAPQKWRPADFAGCGGVARYRPENGHSLRVTISRNGLKSERFDRLAANRCVQELNRVHYGSLLAQARQRGLHLEHTSGISRRHHIGVERLNELSLAITQRIGGIWLHEVEDSRGAAADGGFRNFGKLQPGNARKQSAGL